MAADIPVCYAGSHAQATGTTTNVVTVGTDFGGSPAAFPVIAGETIIACGGAGTSLPTSVGDNTANPGYTFVGGSATSPASWIYALPGSANPLHAAGTGFTANTVTVTWAGAGDGKQTVVMSVPGLLSSPVDGGSVANNTGSGNAPAVTSGALAQARELVVAVCVSTKSAGEAVWPGPWQVIAQGVQTGTTSWCSVAVLRNYTGTAAVTAAPSLPSTSGTWNITIAGFKAAANPLRSYVGATVSNASFADSPTSWGAALEWDADMGRAPSAQRTRVFYYNEGLWATSATSDPQGVISMCNSHASMRPVVSLKPKRMGVATPSTATSEIAAMCAQITAYRNNGVPETRWCLWNECNGNGGTGPFGDGTGGHITTGGDPWAAGGPIPPPAGGWTGAQAASHYQQYCNLYAPPLLLSGYLVAFKPAVFSYQSTILFWPGRAWGTGRTANNTGGCNELILDIYATDPFKDPNNKTHFLAEQLSRGTLTSYQGTDFSFRPAVAFGFGEIGVTDGTVPDDTNPGFTAAWFTNTQAGRTIAGTGGTGTNGAAPVPNPGLIPSLQARMTAGYPLAPMEWFAEKPPPAGNAIDSQGRIDGRADIGNAWRAFYDALSVDAATTGTPPSITTTSPLPAGQVGVFYSTLLQPAGGTAPYTWAITASALPAGLSLNTATGQITGTPTTAQTLSPGFTVTDAAALTGTATLSITIAPAAALTVPPQALPGGTVGAAYSTMLTAANGSSPYTWAITAGALPAGLALTAANGTISGAPTAAGTASFTVQATDHAGATASRALSITVATIAFAITTTTADLPAGTLGAAYTGEIDTAGGTLPVTWAVISGSLPPGLSLAISAAADFHLLDEAGAQILDEAGNTITDETGP